MFTHKTLSLGDHFVLKSSLDSFNGDFHILFAAYVASVAGVYVSRTCMVSSYVK